MTTIIDVAKEAGVSFKTVSRVLNGEPGVREKTREKVLSVASQLNYQLNASARNLRVKKLPMIALLGDNPSRSFVEAIRLGAMMGCQKAGYKLRVESFSNKSSIKELISEDRILGAVLAPPLANAQWVIELLQKADVPYVRICAERVSDEGHKIGIDDRAAARDMADYLIGLGHRRIGIIEGHTGYDSSRRRTLGFKDAMSEAGLPIEADLIVQGEFSFVSGLSAAEKLLSRPNRPTAIFATNDDMAAATLSVAYKFGIDVPSELSVAGFDDSPIARIVYPRLTTIKQAVPDMAERAIEILSRTVKYKDDELVDIQLVHELIERGSTGPVL